MSIFTKDRESAFKLIDDGASDNKVIARTGFRMSTVKKLRRDYNRGVHITKLDAQVKEMTEALDESLKAKSEVLGTGIRFIPLTALIAIGAIFLEGAKKYGQDNWKLGLDDSAWISERTEHALTHFFKWISGDRSEPHLAKVAWFCIVMLCRKER